MRDVDAAGAFGASDRLALDRLHALAAAEVGTGCLVEDAGTRQLIANRIAFTDGSALHDRPAADDEDEQRLLADFLERFTPLRRAVARTLRRRAA